MSDERWIAVGAEGEASVAPDMAVVSLSVSGKGKELGAARDDVNARTSAVLERLRALGVADADLGAPDVAIQPEYDYRRGGQQLLGYAVTRHVTARVRSVDSLGAVLDGAVTAGANEVHGAEMAASDPSAAEHEALRRAVEAAHAKAEAIAAAAGVALGSLVRVEEADGPGLPQPRMRMAALAESADIPTEVAAGDLTVRRRIRAWFAIA
jgi:hypothetical protein